MNLSRQGKLLLSALILAGAAHAQSFESDTNIYGGGATSPAIAFIGVTYRDVTPPARLSTFSSNTAGTGFTQVQPSVPRRFGAPGGSIFLSYLLSNGSAASYCQTGSGFGKSVLTAESNDLGHQRADDNCRDFSVSPIGLSAPSGQDAPDFISSSAPLTVSNYDSFEGNDGSFSRAASQGNLVQIPVLSQRIALPVNLPNTTTRQNLSVEEVCGIFSGEITNWWEIGVTPDSQPINVVFRSDDSGTVFAFTQFLAANCNGMNGRDAAFFNTNELFSAALPNFPGYLYRSFSTGSGDNGVINAVHQTPYSIGFANFSNVAVSNTDYALVNGRDPANSNNSVYYNYRDVLTDKLLGAPSSTTGLPETTNVGTVARADPQGCVRLINPAAQLEGIYPIAAVTNIETYTNNREPAAVRALIKQILQTPASNLPPGYTQLGPDVRAELIGTNGNGGTVARCIN